MTDVNVVTPCTCVYMYVAFVCDSGRLVQWRRHLERRALRAAEQRVAHGVRHVEATLRRGRRRAQQPALRRRWS